MCSHISGYVLVVVLICLLFVLFLANLTQASAIWEEEPRLRKCLYQMACLWGIFLISD